MKSIALHDGARIAFQEWGSPSSMKKVLSLHGWLDNSNSFRLLAPQVAQHGYHCIAVDLLGHGHSSHLSKDAVYLSHKNIATVREIVESLGWQKHSLVSHSMGAGISLLYSGVFPEIVEKLVLIEGFGPWTKPSNEAPLNLRHAIEAELRSGFRSATGSRKPKGYETLGSAIQTRIRNVASYPGKQTLSYEAAKLLVSR